MLRGLPVNLRHALVALDMADDFGQQWCDAENGEVGGRGGGRGKRVRRDDFFDSRFVQALRSVAREHRMCGGGVDVWQRSVLAERGDGGGERSGGIDDVVEDDARFTGDVSYDMVHIGLVCAGAIFVEDGEGGGQGISELLRPLGATDVGGDDDWGGEALGPEVIRENGPCMEGVHGNGEEALDLVAVEIEGDDVIGAGFLEEMCHELGGNRLARFGDAVLARVGEVREDHVDGGGEAELRRLAEEEKFHDVLIRRAAARLKEVDGITANGFLEADVPLSATECPARRFPQGDTEFVREALGQVPVR